MQAFSLPLSWPENLWHMNDWVANQALKHVKRLDLCFSISVRSGLYFVFLWIDTERQPVKGACNNNKKHLHSRHHLHKGVAERRRALLRTGWGWGWDGKWAVVTHAGFLALKLYMHVVTNSRISPSSPLVAGNSHWHVDWAKLIAISYASPFGGCGPRTRQHQQSICANVTNIVHCIYVHICLFMRISMCMRYMRGHRLERGWFYI